MAILRQQELVSYGLTDTVANIGGYLGLFIGLSCFAFIDQLCQLAARLFKAWCLLGGKNTHNCCKKNTSEKTVRIEMPTASQRTSHVSIVPPSAPQAPMATLSDTELTLFRMNQQQQQMQQEQPCHLDVLSQGQQMALAKPYLVA